MPTQEVWMALLQPSSFELAASQIKPFTPCLGAARRFASTQTMDLDSQYWESCTKIRSCQRTGKIVETVCSRIETPAKCPKAMIKQLRCHLQHDQHASIKKSSEEPVLLTGRPWKAESECRDMCHVRGLMFDQCLGSQLVQQLRPPRKPTGLEPHFHARPPGRQRSLRLQHSSTSCHGCDLYVFGPRVEFGPQSSEPLITELDWDLRYQHSAAEIINRNQVTTRSDPSREHTTYIQLT